MSLLIVLAALTPPPAPHDGAAGSSGRSLAGSRSRRALTTSADIPMPTEKRPAMSNDQVLTREIAERPEGYQGPNLSPVGLKLGAHRFTDGLDPVLAAALARYPVPAARAQQGMLNLVRNLHRLNIMATYRLYEAGAAGRTPG